MTAIIISNTPPFGAMTNNAVAALDEANSMILRLQAAVATASSGYTGTDGTEYETDTNFGVQPSDTPGEQGKAFSFAVGTLANAWATFWTAANDSLKALDNGVRTP